jgi:hypothetical protein
MKNFIAAIIGLCLITTSQAQTTTFQRPNGFIYDNAEQNPLYSWGMDFTKGYAMVTGGNQDLSNNDSRAYMSVSSTYARKGTKSYKMYVEKRTDYPGCCNWVRSEVMWLSPDQQTKENAWKIAAVSILIDPSWQFENRPTQIAFDTKASPDDLQTPFWLGIMNGQYYVDGYFMGGTTYLGAVTKGVWVDWVVERNWYAGVGHPNNVMFGASDGYVRLYRDGNLVFEKTGVNYFGRNGDAAIARMQIGLYKWVWATSGGQGWGEGNPVSAANAPITAYYDEFYFGFAGNTKEQVFSRLSGGTPTNQPPVVANIDNITVNYPGTSTSITASATDPDGTIASYAWTKQSGGSATLTNANTATVNITGMVPGTYVFRVTATDNQAAQGVYDVTVTVNASSPPTGSAPYATSASNIATPIPDMSVQLPKTDTSFTIYSDVAGTSGWVGEQLIFKLSGPTGGTPTRSNQTGDNPTRITIDLASLQQGTYVYRFQMTDNTGNFTRNDTFNVVVQPATNVAPTVNAGTTYRMGYPDANITVTGTASDPDGPAPTVRWDKVSGPSGGNIASPTALSTAINVPNAGVYVFRLTATDNQGKTATDTMSVVVESVSAGIDTTLIAPAASLTLKSVASNQGSATVLWTKVSGGSVTIVSPTSANTVVNGLAPGEYIFKVRASYNSGVVFTEDEVVVKVLGTTVTTRPVYILDIQLKN